jgi:hypothetical protein
MLLDCVHGREPTVIRGHVFLRHPSVLDRFVTAEAAVLPCLRFDAFVGLRDVELEARLQRTRRSRR